MVTHTYEYGPDPKTLIQVDFVPNLHADKLKENERAKTNAAAISLLL